MSIDVKVQPKSRVKKVEKLSKNSYKVWVHAAPEKGKANKETLNLLAAYFHLPVSSLRITKGSKSHFKRIAIQKTP